MHPPPRLTMDEMVIDYRGRLPYETITRIGLSTGEASCHRCAPHDDDDDDDDDDDGSPLPCVHVLLVSAKLAAYSTPLGFAWFSFLGSGAFMGTKLFDMDRSRSTRCTLPGLSTVILGFSQADDCILRTPCLAQPRPIRSRLRSPCGASQGWSQQSWARPYHHAAQTRPRQREGITGLTYRIHAWSLVPKTRLKTKLIYEYTSDPCSWSRLFLIMAFSPCRM
ncbi:hypothetical protein CGRA01v4_14595 [Colletotrichum graminicola]|nr:hypothetical protein CGRA01v4_14595 [Colletotrichum graminicola]